MKTTAQFHPKALGLLFGIAACQPSSGPSAESRAQMTMGTQTGGSTEELDCGLEGWEPVDEETPFGEVYVGALQLQGWRVDCEKACVQASCRTNCSLDCSLTEPPAGSDRAAVLRLRPTGAIERRLLPREGVDEACETQRRTMLTWTLEVDGGFVASGNATFHFTTEDWGWINPDELQFVAEPNLQIPTASDFQALGSKDRNDEGEVTAGVYMQFAGGEVGVEMAFYCADCSDRVGLPLAAGVLHEEGKPHQPPNEPTITPNHWMYPSNECVQPSPGSGGTPNVSTEGGSAGEP